MAHAWLFTAIVGVSMATLVRFNSTMVAIVEMVVHEEVVIIVVAAM